MPFMPEIIAALLSSFVTVQGIIFFSIVMQHVTHETKEIKHNVHQSRVVKRWYMQYYICVVKLTVYCTFR